MTRPPADYRRILLVRLSALGDVVNITGFPRAIRAACPNAEIIVATGAANAPVLRHAADIDRLISLGPHRRLHALWLEARRALAPYRSGAAIDLALDLQGIRASAAIVYASGAALQAGRGRWRPGWRFTVRPDYHVAEVAENAAILERLGIAAPDPAPRLSVRPEADAELGALLAKAGLPPEGFLAVNPFGRWPAKQWPIERYAALLPRLKAATGIPIVITAGPDEIASAARLIEAMPAGTAASFAGRLSLDQLFALLARARLLLTGDSGPMHAAAALGRPVVALFGPTWPERAGPRGTGHILLQARRAADYHAYHDPAAVACMAAIEVVEVERAVQAQLERPAPGAEGRGG